MNPVFLPLFEQTEQITDILVAAGLDAKVFVPGDEPYPSLGVFVTDPREPKALWEFTPSATEGDPSGWLYQIGTYVGDEYEGIVYEYMSHHLTPDSTAEQVADEIKRTVAAGIAPEDLTRIVDAYNGLAEG